MSQLIKKIIISTIVLLVLDFTFLSVNKTAFENEVISVQRVIMRMNPVGAFFSYLFIIFAINYFILLKNRPVFEAAILGLIINGVYESTNYAIFKKWSANLAIMDTIWGGFLFALTTQITYTLSNL
uniref:DUF2177 family protein n=1 Tax=viral metagenome TaxID=1070528 RepID=A0A6C0JH21_9ZZZZ